MATAPIPPLLRDASDTLESLGSTVDCVILEANGEQVCLRPIRVVSRCHIPLSYIQFPLSNSKSRPRFFSLPNVEAKGRFSDLYNGFPILAQDCQTEALCVLERVRGNVYSLLLLKSSLSEKDISAAVPTPSHTENCSAWWKQAQLDTKEEDGAQERPRKRVKLDMTRPVAKLEAIQPDWQPHESPRQIDKPAQAQLQSEQLFETLVCQYLDALYLSRTSLAFFAKGPLSRIRIAFTSTTNENLTVQELSSFLRSMILSHNSLDKKFKEKLPSMADELAMKIYDDDDVDDNRKKSRKKRRLKINREGMYPFEHDYVRKWWKGVDEPMDTETRDEKVRRRVGDLRVRQTLIQIILLLEIMALEASQLWKTSQEIKEDTKSNSAKRNKKPLELSLVLDLLLDKLSIWQSVELDTLHSASDAGTERKTWSQDQLGSFCIDVLIPFYKSRIPEKTVQIVQRFGISSGSPEKRNEIKKSKQVKDSKKDSNKKPRKQLIRSTSQSQSNILRAGSLSRSMTDTSMLVPSIKREPSEARSIASIPPLHEKVKSRRDSMASLKHLKSRQISLSSLSVSKERKRKNEAAVEDELRNAIDSIKKPNRSMIGRQVADEREKLKSLNTSRGKTKVQSSDRKALRNMENVQVLATPQHNRVKHAHTGHALKIHDNQPDFVTSSAVKPQSHEHIPATDMKSIPESTHMAQHHIMETPSKGSLRHFTLHSSPEKYIGDSDVIPNSTIKPRMFTEIIPVSSPIIPLGTKPSNSYPKYSFGRALPETRPGMTSPLSSRRLTAIPATPIKKASM